MPVSFARLFGRARSADPRDLAAFLARQAAYITQKTVLDYCRVKAGAREKQTFADPAFQAAMEYCRWQTFCGTAQDVVAMAEAWLRPHVPDREGALADVLARIGSGILHDSEAPPEQRADLEAAAAALGRHLAQLQLAAPKQADKLPLLAQAPLLATLPIHPDQRVGETPAITGALRFHIVAAQQEMERAFDAPGLAAALVAA